MNKYIAPRGDHFYYIEVWNKELLRDQKISDILDLVEITNPKYLHGSSSTLILSESIEFAIFWKTKESVEYRISNLKKRKKDNVYIIKYFDRDEFISKIPDVFSCSIKYTEKIRLSINQELKKKEINYKKKIENIWLERIS